MRDVDSYIREGRAACSEKQEITINEIRKLYSDSGKDIFALIVNTFYFGFAAGSRVADRKGQI